MSTTGEMLSFYARIAALEIGRSFEDFDLEGIGRGVGFPQGSFVSTGSGSLVSIALVSKRRDEGQSILHPENVIAKGKRLLDAPYK